MAIIQPNWTVLLIAGPSGVGKSSVAPLIAVRYGVAWLMVDDLRLALQRSRVTLPERTNALYCFETAPDVRQLPPERRRDAAIAVGEVLSPAIEVVVENHVDQAIPIVIEGDAIQPALLDRPPVQTRAGDGRIHAVFLVEPDAEAFLSNIRSRRSRIAGWTDYEVALYARGMWLYGQWLAREAHRFGVPVITPRPWATLVDRIIAAIAPAAP
jgi:2-phosphoglycerate kinase